MLLSPSPPSNLRTPSPSRPPRTPSPSKSTRLTSSPSPLLSSPRPRTASPSTRRTASPSTRQSSSLSPSSSPSSPSSPVDQVEISLSTSRVASNPTPSKTKHATLSHRTKSREKERPRSIDFTYVDSSLAFDVKRTTDHGSQARVMLRQLHNRDVEGSVEWILKNELQLAFDRLEHEKAVLAKQVAEFEKEKEEVHEDRRVLTLESMNIYKEKELLILQKQELEQAREEFKQDELDFCREKMRVFVQSDTLAVARADIIQERLDVDKDYEMLERRTVDNEKKLLRALQETKEVQAENDALVIENRRLRLDLEVLRDETAKQKLELSKAKKNQDENTIILRKLDALELALKSHANPAEMAAALRLDGKEIEGGYDDELDGLAEHESNGEPVIISTLPSSPSSKPLPALPSAESTQNDQPAPGSPVSARQERMSKLRSMLHSHVKKTGSWKFGKS